MMKVVLLLCILLPSLFLYQEIITGFMRSIIRSINQMENSDSLRRILLLCNIVFSIMNVLLFSIFYFIYTELRQAGFF